MPMKPLTDNRRNRGVRTGEAKIQEPTFVRVLKSQGSLSLQSGDEVGGSDVTGPESKIADTIEVHCHPVCNKRYYLRSCPRANPSVEEPGHAYESELDGATPKKETPPREKRRSPAKEIVGIEDDESDEEAGVDPDDDGSMPNDSPEPVQANGQSGLDHGTSTPNSVSAASSRPRRSVQQPSRFVSDTSRSSVQQRTGSAKNASVTIAVSCSPGSQQQTRRSQAPVHKHAPSQSDMRPPPIRGTKDATQLQRSNSQSSTSASASNSHSSATPRTQASSQPLVLPHTSATSLTPQQQVGNWPSAFNPLAPQGAHGQLARSQQSTPHHLAPSRGNKRPVESSPIASYASNTPTNTSRSGAKRQRSSNAVPYHQSQVSRAINWDAVLPSGDEFQKSLKNASDAIKPVLHKFEELLADINDEQRRLSVVQSSLFHKKNDYENDQKKAQDALKDVEKSTANENTTLRGLEEVYQQNPGDAELRTFINKRKQTILEHKEVYIIVKSQLDKSIAGIYKTDHEIALVTKRLGQLDTERAEILKEKEAVDKAAKRVMIMSKFMKPSWQATLDMLLQSVGPEVLEKVF